MSAVVDVDDIDDVDDVDDVDDIDDVDEVVTGAPGVVAAVVLTLRRRPGAKHQDPAAQSGVRAVDRIRMVKMDATRPAPPAPVEGEGTP